MKKIITIVLSMLVTIAVFGQAKKPTIMVVPSDQYCISRGYKLEFDDMGTKKVLPDYKAALQDDSDLRLVISKMSGIMADRGFPLKDLEQMMKKLENERAQKNMTTSASTGMGLSESPIDMLLRTARADIIMDLSFEVKKQGPRSYITYILNGLDAYTSKNVASSSGAGNPSSAASVDVLLEEAVLARMDEFNDRLMAHFTDMFEKGREVTIQVLVSDGSMTNLESEAEWKGRTGELRQIINAWFIMNTVEKRFSREVSTANQLVMEQVRIDMFVEDPWTGEKVGQDTETFAQKLRTFLTDELSIGETVQVAPKGLGEAWLILGGK
ncbi:MAG: DUF6175 family protein [Salinivirgaceae bacterium]|jgi:hypothetical protein|nr:DUF6175 family protein [Salinivirgaceae bacterium]